MDLGLFRVAAAVPRVKVADVEYNAESICRLTGRPKRKVPRWWSSPNYR